MREDVYALLCDWLMLWWYQAVAYCRQNAGLSALCLFKREVYCLWLIVPGIAMEPYVAEPETVDSQEVWGIMKEERSMLVLHAPISCEGIHMCTKYTGREERGSGQQGCFSW